MADEAVSLTLVDVADFSHTGLGTGEVAVRTFVASDGAEYVMAVARIATADTRMAKLATAHVVDQKAGDASRYTGSIRLANLDALTGRVTLANGHPVKVGMSVALQDESPIGIAAFRRAARNAAAKQARAAGARVLESAQAAVVPTPPAKPTRSALKAAFTAGAIDADTFTARYAEATE